MRLTLDFSTARITPTHGYVNVHAAINGGESTRIAIEADGCHRDHGMVGGLPCKEPVIDHIQAWSAAILLTGRESLEPRGQGEWSAGRRTMTYTLGRSRCRIMA